ncbi:cupin domain-containing protein [Tolypothrix sp. FACHB-123]|uniref:cupin domain-containing protein n=1 Tax=Tolypothrix sp. FACHB-123 TaxID=2692868 RepID=UPI00168210CA|nr:cupin domain-containing protein [Tolypothrix sp. FACHB-123]MBD2356839.1 cupin domain-containing protein [Tolypothrix sp. FACHB-123]
MTFNLTRVVQQSGQGDSYWVLGDLYTFKAVGEDTGQTYALVEIIMQPQSGTPPHIHSHENESFYIQEGELEVQLGEEIVVATPGTFLHSPKGQLHRLINNTTQPVKLLCWVAPAGAEKFFMEIGVPAIDIKHSPTVSPADIEKVIATAPKYGLQIILPPSQ